MAGIKVWDKGGAVDNRIWGNVSDMPYPPVPQSMRGDTPRHDRHILQRIIKLRSAITADLVASACNGENPTQVRMTTSECKIQNLYQRMHEPIPAGQFFTYRHFRSPWVESHFDFLLRIYRLKQWGTSQRVMTEVTIPRYPRLAYPFHQRPAPE